MPHDWPAPTIFTIGHSTRPIAEFLPLLRQVAIDLVVDVRSIPRSRTNPQYNADVLPQALAAAGIDYRHARALGGRRPRRKGDCLSGNTMWRNQSFRNFADYAETEAFHAGLDELGALAGGRRCVLMCAEAVWWRCHRRIIADYLVTSGRPVAHIMGPGKIEAATLTPGAQVLADGNLAYPAAAGA
jgi:uncharacterized protein (DUF488 family)